MSNTIFIGYTKYLEEACIIMPKNKPESRLKEYKLVSQNADEDSKNLLKGLGKPVKPRRKSCATKTLICLLITCFITLIIGLGMLVTLIILYPDDALSISGLREIYQEMIKRNGSWYRNSSQLHTTDQNHLSDIPDSRNWSVMHNQSLRSNGTFFEMPALFNGSEFENTTIGPMDENEPRFELVVLEGVLATLHWTENYLNTMPLAVLICICTAIALMIFIPCVICCRRKMRQRRRRRLLGVLVSDLRSEEKKFSISDSSDDEEA
ncbi:uncharacterized protein LOC136028878 isoform X1 [Artemia franciscana]|uniref:uncharacterized protein LOC136028878 isoform X1 n=1 Tax=Artemia franciscana TaxID=6661 RepID=UPI0032DB0E15